MINLRNGASITALLLSFAVCGASQAMASSCEDLKNAHLPDTTITSAESVAAGSFTTPEGSFPIRHPSPQELPGFCRVVGTIRPTPDSDIGFEVWMPSSGWNGKFMSTFEGGQAGAINYAGLARTLARGYAAASTDTGHQEPNFNDYAVNSYVSSHFIFDWAVGHNERRKDYAYRAKHLQTVDAKALVQTFYGSPPQHSYISGCSNGGRQGLMEAQRFPDDYDGIIAGAPDIFWDHVIVLSLWNGLALSETPGSWIPPTKLPAIQKAALASCRPEAGAIGGLVENPAACHFDPAKLLCKKADSDTCLTAPQVVALRKIVDGARTSDGKQIYPGYDPEYAAADLTSNHNQNWAYYVMGSAPGAGALFQMANGFFGKYVFQSADWDYRTFSFDRDMPFINDMLDHELNAVDPDLTAFKARGGKVIIYQGGADIVVLPEATINYYRSVTKKMGGEHATREFARLFMAPGMEHCGQGPGPDSFGRMMSNDGVPLPGDREHDLTTALEQWVEHGVAPENIVATKFVQDDPKQGAARTHLLCPYPEVARYTGKGSTDAAENFVCARTAAPPGH